MWLLTVWRYSFDYCESTKLDPSTYLDSHLDLILRGLESDEMLQFNRSEATSMSMDRKRRA